jgi:hypothetical protein
MVRRTSSFFRWMLRIEIVLDILWKLLPIRILLEKPHSKGDDPSIYLEQVLVPDYLVLDSEYDFLNQVNRK